MVKGWGGQEIRIIRDAVELENRGYQVLIAVSEPF
jgi:hypothetical protein